MPAVVRDVEEVSDIQRRRPGGHDDDDAGGDVLGVTGDRIVQVARRLMGLKVEDTALATASSRHQDVRKQRQHTGVGLDLVRQAGGQSALDDQTGPLIGLDDSPRNSSRLTGSAGTVASGIRSPSRAGRGRTGLCRAREPTHSDAPLEPPAFCGRLVRRLSTKQGCGGTL